MQITFDEVFERTIGHEGGYVNNPKDPGGETNWGITIATARENGFTNSMKSMTRAQAKEIYRVAFWKRAKCDQFTGAISYQIFDAAVNHGIGNAIRMLQRAVGVLDDGKVGDETLGAIKKMTLDDVLVLFIAERLEFYTKLSTFNSFGRGWARRVVGNLRYAAGDTP
ncbi:glycoside hydrolase family 108 protein [Acinetobacter baumannii]|uniref:glycoside hydrolase family 108 protein n=1 Tax=Acinetobacter calcoaceticus/baumannii complex TaxID=909768 RepID=UPI0005EADB38|nr:glycoside hydrolase family 108 protein [Acinetobacter pittii]HCQ9810041.1 glycoside hydrolase family 108 protein [Acinetobacter baumannii]